MKLRKRNLAKAQLEEAQKRAGEIKEQGISLLNKRKLYVLNKRSKMQIVLFKGKHNLFTTTKAIEQISQQIVVLANEQVRGKLQTKANGRFHVSVNC
jgi:tmRNA-binding protein